jgi:hypothetical protein
MANPKEKSPSTPDGIVLWQDLFEAKLSQDPKPNEKPKFSVRLGFTEADMKTPEFAALKRLVVETAKASVWGSKAEAMIKEGSVRLPFRMDIAAKGYDESLKCFVNLKSVRAPGIVDRYADPVTGKARVITKSSEVYSGCIGRATVSAYAYGGGTTGFTPGVSLGLVNFQLRNEAGKTYERLDGRANADDDFGADAPVEVDFSAEGGAPTGVKDDLNDLLS